MSKNAKRFNKQNQQSLVTMQADSEARAENLGITGNWDLDWFKPTEKQKEIFYKLDSEDVDFVLVNAPSGCGKTTAAIAKALTDLKKGKFKHLRFVRTPFEAGDDQIGYLSGDANQKLEKHFEVMRGLFADFMHVSKLKADEKRGIIRFDIPNYITGATLNDTFLIVDEAQTLQPQTLKLVLERLGEGSKAVVLYDHKQRYAAKQRPDGALDLECKILKRDQETGEILEVEELFAYVEMTTNDNKRSRASKKITELYR